MSAPRACTLVRGGGADTAPRAARPGRLVAVFRRPAPRSRRWRLLAAFFVAPASAVAQVVGIRASEIEISLRAYPKRSR